MSRNSIRARLAAAAVLMAAVAGLSSAATASAAPNVRPHDAENCDGGDVICFSVTGNAGNWSGKVRVSVGWTPGFLIHGFISIKGAGVHYTSQTQDWMTNDTSDTVHGGGIGEVCAEFWHGPLGGDGHFDRKAQVCEWIS